MTEPVTLGGGDYRAVVDPAHGGAILSASWRSPADDTFAILEPMKADFAPFKAGCFAMVPFANRIADGRFRFEGHDYALPINHAVEAVAIHGFGRENPWRIVEQTAARLTLEQDFAQAEILFLLRCFSRGGNDRPAGRSIGSHLVIQRRERPEGTSAPMDWPRSTPRGE